MGAIRLDDEQLQLFCEMVEAQNSLPRSQRRKFIFVKAHDGSSLLHEGFPQQRIVFEGDLETLAEYGLLRMSYGSRGSPVFDITPEGFHLYTELRRSQGEPVTRMEAHVRTLIDSERFQNAYARAYAKWCDAESMLWDSDSQEQLSKIGHVCRESMIEFVDSLVDRLGPPDIDTDSAKTVNRLRAILSFRSEELGSTERPFLEALVDYWYKLSDLVQRQEHAALREKEELVWEDGRRVVFHTALAMYEIDRTLFS